MQLKGDSAAEHFNQVFNYVSAQEVTRSVAGFIICYPLPSQLLVQLDWNTVPNPITEDTNAVTIYSVQPTTGQTQEQVAQGGSRASTLG